MRWTIRIKQRSTSGIYDSEITCYSVVFIHNLVANLTRAMHVYLTSTLSMCKTQWHATQYLYYSSWIHVGTWHMWRRCRDILVWIDHSDVLLVPEECTRPPWAILAVHARSEDVHACHARTHSLARTCGYTSGRNFVPRSTPCDNLFTSLMVN